MRDYSQAGEQRLVLAWARGRPPGGRFLDVGAYDGVTFSNTRALREFGWSGVLVEPSPRPFFELALLYRDDPKATLVQAAIAPADIDDERLRPFAIALVDRETTALWADTLSSLDVDYVRRRTPTHAEVLVPVVSAGELIAAVGRDFDVVSVDAEGCSVDVLLRLLVVLGDPGPGLIVVEPDGELDVLAELGYRLVAQTGNNAIYSR